MKNERIQYEGATKYFKKALLFVAAVILSTGSIVAHADPRPEQGPIDSCLNRVRLISSSACKGVKTEEEADAVVACVNGVSPYVSPVCRGVKTADEADAVISCANAKSPFNARRFCGNAE